MVALEIGHSIACVALILTARLGIAAEVAPTAPGGDPRTGEALYVGEARLANGGAPCLACHGIAGHGLARAASFGPDLTGAFETFGAEALDGALADVAFPSMQPIYNTHALTPAERADLVAFLGKAGGAAPSHLGAQYAAGVALAFAALGVGFVLVGRGARRRRPSPPRRSPRS